MGQAIKGIGNAIGSIAHVASPLIGMLPGGGLINSAIDMAGNVLGGGAGPGAQAAGIGGLGLAGIQALGGFNPNVNSTTNGATGTANNYSNYLGGFLQNGSQNQNQMNSAIQGMLSGRPGDPTNLQNYFNAGMGSNGGAQFNPNQGIGSPDQVSGGFNQQFLPSNIQAQQVNSGFNPGQVNTQYNPQQISGGYNAPQFNAGPNVMQGFGAQSQLPSIINPQGAVDATKQLFQQQDAQNVANLRERFGNQALGSGAQLAEGQYRAQAAPQQALAIDQIARANNDQLLNQNQLQLQNQTQNRGLDINQLGLGLQQSGAQNTFNQGNSQFGANLDQNAQLANQAAGFQAAGFGQQGQSLNNQFGLSANQQLLNALQGNQSANLQAAGLNQQAGSLNNQFSQANAAQQLQAAMSNQGSNLQAMLANQQNGQFNINSLMQNQGLMNNFAGMMQGIGAQREGIQAQGQQSMLAQLMNALGNTQQLGTAQANTTVSPGWGTNLINGAGALGGLYGQVNQAQNAAPGGNFDFGKLASMLGIGGAAPAIQQTPSAMIPQGAMPNIMQMPINNPYIMH